MIMVGELDTVAKNTVIPTMHQILFHRGERKMYPVNGRKILRNDKFKMTVPFI